MTSETALRRSETARDIPLSAIVVGERQRAIDPATVAQLAEDISRQGLLCPIGLRAQADPARFDLIYGAHRVEAVRSIDPGASIAALIWPAETPDWQVKMTEIAENLLRKDLTQSEREAQTVAYVGLLKEGGLVVRAGESRARGRWGAKNNKEDDLPLHSSKPTVREKAAKDLGVSVQTIGHHTKAAVKKARAAGVEVPAGERTAETMTPPTAAKVAAAAARAPSPRQGPKPKGAAPAKPNGLYSRTGETPHAERALAVVRPLIEAGEPVSVRTLMRETGLSQIVIEVAVNRVRGEIAGRQAAIEAADAIDPAEVLSASAQAKLDAFKKQLERQMEARFWSEVETRVRAEVKEKLAAAIAKRDAADAEAIEQANRLMESRRGGRGKLPFTADEFSQVLLWAVHPDCNDPAKRTEAFVLLRKNKLLLCEPGPVKKYTARLPQTLEGLHAFKAQHKASAH
jgi:hypothetical protein